MKVYYRITDKLSTNPNPLGKNKTVIIDACLVSFKQAGRAEITYVIDGNVNEEFLNGKVVHTEEPGINGSISTTLELMADNPDNEPVMMVEDDYLWVPNCLKMLEFALDELPLISPYDHPGHYLEDRFKYQPKQMRMIQNHVYRQAPSNTHTFACKAWVVKQNLEMMKKYGMRDHEMFTELGIDLFVPVPSFATHLVTGLLAPNVDWGL